MRDMALNETEWYWMNIDLFFVCGLAARLEQVFIHGKYIRSIATVAQIDWKKMNVERNRGRLVGLCGVDAI